jgi:hypothetical protein
MVAIPPAVFREPDVESVFEIVYLQFVYNPQTSEIVSAAKIEL